MLFRSENGEERVMSSTSKTKVHIDIWDILIFLNFNPHYRDDFFSFILYMNFELCSLLENLDIRFVGWRPSQLFQLTRS